MRIRGRIGRLSAALAGRGGPDLAHIVVWVLAGGDPDGRPPGVYRTGGVLDVVYESDKPDPALEARVRPQATPAALTIVLGPEVVPAPTIDADGAETADRGRRW